MSAPPSLYLIKIYDKSLTEKYSITDGAIAIKTRMGFNDDIGHFEILLPQQVGFTYKYNDIVVGDKVKVWYGNKTGDLTGNPDFMGKILQPLSNSGKVKTLRGKPNGEILTRRIKARTIWEGADAHDIADEVASDLSLDTSLISASTVPITLTIDSETYADILRKISDYYYNALTIARKDYYVTVDGKLFWQDRPYRTTGVETLTYGKHYTAYLYGKEGTNIKNAVGVYGALTPFYPADTLSSTDTSTVGRKFPVNGDSWTYDANWTAITGTVASDNTAVKVGSTCTRATATGAGSVAFTHPNAATLSVEGLQGYSAIEFYSRRILSSNPTIRIYAPDASNYFVSDDVVSTVDNTWELTRLALGKNNEYNATTNPAGQWQVGAGSPDWNQMATVYFDAQGVIGATFDVDGLCFNFGRWRYIPASDATSITDYEEYDNIIIDDNLKSDAECEYRAKTWLYQQYQPVTRFEPEILGNKNILLGDRLTITLPPEGLSATNFYVTGVEHQYIQGEGWKTIPTLMDSTNTRIRPPFKPDEIYNMTIRNLQQISRNQRRVN